VRVPVTGLALAMTILSAGCGGDREEMPGGEPAPVEAWTPSFSMTLAEVGFAGPASALHDPAEDVYLVANVNGGPAEKDGNGFISRISPLGRILDLKWLDGAGAGVTLHAPRGMAILADTLFVTDIDCLRRFHRVTGQAFLETCLEHATLLTGLAATPQGDVFFSDGGASPAPGAVYLLKNTAEAPQTLATADSTLLEGEGLGGPSGLSLDAGGLLVVTSGSGELFRVTSAGERVQLLEPSALGLHGVLSLGEEGMLVSSWGDSAVYRVAGDGTMLPLITSVETPSGMGYDASRNRVLIPLLSADELRVLSLSPLAHGGGSSL